MKKKLMAFILIFSLFFPATAFGQNERNREKPCFIYGAALSEKDINMVAGKLGIERGQNVNENRVTGSDLDKYLKTSGTPDSNMISSVAVTKLKKGSGIKVNIKTPGNISLINEGDYANAAITAGASDLNIDVASPYVVTGESALSGVYKAIELNGGRLDSQRTEAAQEELATLKEIGEDNKSNQDFDKNKLNEAVVKVKQDLQDNKEKTGSLASDNQIRDSIVNALKDVNMEDVLSDNNINILVNYFNNYQKTSAVDSKQVKEELGQLADQFKNGVEKIYEDNKSTIDNIGDQAQKSGLLDQLADFFASLRNSIVAIFNK